jgi:hypothetical protein
MADAPGVPQFRCRKGLRLTTPNSIGASRYLKLAWSQKTDVNNRLEGSTVVTLRRSSLTKRNDEPYEERAIIRTLMNAATITPVPIGFGTTL